MTNLIHIAGTMKAAVHFPQRIWMLIASRFCVSAAGILIVPYVTLLMTEEYRLPATWAAIVAGFIFIGGRLLSYPINVLSDRFGGTPMLQWSCYLGAASTMLFSLPSHGPGIAIVAVAGLSLTSAAFTPVLRTLIARTAGRELTTIVSIAGAASHVGNLVGAALGGILISTGRLSLVGIVGSVAFVSAAYCVWSARSGKYVHEGEALDATRPRATQLRDGDAIRLRFLALTNFAIGYLGTTIYLGLAIYAERAFGNAAAASAFFGVESLVLIVVLPPIGAAIRSINSEKLFAMYSAGLLLAPLGFVVLSVAPASFPWLAIVLLATLLSTGQCLAMPAGDPLIARSFHNEELAHVFGLITTATALGSAASSITTGLGLDLLPTNELWKLWFVPGVVWLIALATAAAKVRMYFRDLSESR